MIRKAKSKSRKSFPKPKEASPVLKEASNCALSEPTALVSLAVASRSSSNLVGGSQSLPTICSDDLDWLVTTTSLPFCMQPTIEETGFNYFVFNFVRFPNGPSHGYFHYVNDLGRTGALDNTVHAAITAAGLAGNATKTRSALLMARARREYAIALQKINAALKSPIDCLKDSILLSIIVVAIFETIVGAKECASRSFRKRFMIFSVYSSVFAASISSSLTTAVSLKEWTERMIFPIFFSVSFGAGSCLRDCKRTPQHPGLPLIPSCLQC